MIKSYIFFILAYIFTFALTYIGVEKIRRWSLKREIIDIPNERSSHTMPTPHGGGLIICSVCLTLFLLYCIIFQLYDLWAYFVGALVVAMISWLDDLFTISVVWRFLAHSLAAGLVIWSLGFWETAYIPFIGTVIFSQSGILLTFLWIVWLINAYNFMDGIDGIAGAQAVSAGLGWLFVGIILNSENTGFLGTVVAISSLAFLKYNWQPAKIFMGDVGSAFLGYTFAVMPLIAIREIPKSEHNLLPVLSIFLLLPFVFDSLLTVFQRTVRMKKIWQAHREHLYQKLVISGLSHQFVTTIYLSISIITAVLLLIWLKYRLFVGDYAFIAIFFELFLLTLIYFKRNH